MPQYQKKKKKKMKGYWFIGRMIAYVTKAIIYVVLLGSMRFAYFPIDHFRVILLPVYTETFVVTLIA